MFSKLKVYGYSDINYIWSKKNISEDEITSIKALVITTPAWDDNTITLSTFNNNINASDISEVKEVVQYIVQKRNISGNKRSTVATIPYDCTSIEDYNVSDSSEYEYYIIPVYKEDNGKSMGEPITSNMISTDFGSVSIIGLLPTQDKNVYLVDTNNIWVFPLNVEHESFKQQYNKSILSGISKFPKISVNDTNYLTTNISCLIGNVDCSGETYSNDSIEVINKWKEFCINGCMKLYKDEKGHVIPCEITDMSYDFDNSILQMPTTISFQITQIDSAESLSVYNIEV